MSGGAWDRRLSFKQGNKHPLLLLFYSLGLDLQTVGSVSGILIIAYIICFKPAVGGLGGGGGGNSPGTSGQFSYQNFFMKCPTVDIVPYIRPTSLDSRMLQHRLRWSRGSVLAFSTQVCGFKPGRSRRIFRAKKSSACLPSEGK